MSRLRPRVITAADVRRDATTRRARSPDEGGEDNYTAKLIKYIPAEIIALHQSLAGFATTTQAGAPVPFNDTLIQWLIVGLLILTPFWFAASTRARGEPVAWSQIVLSTLAFVIWLLAVHSPMLSLPALSFTGLAAQNADDIERAGTILFIFFTGVTPMLERIIPRPA